jgi:single-stranded DNA-binding protein
MNKVFLTGRFTNDAVALNTSPEMPGAKFSLAIDERFGKEEKTIFVNCTV